MEHRLLSQVWEVRIRRNNDERNAAFFTCTQMVSATGPA